MACRVDVGFENDQTTYEELNKVTDMLCRLCETCDMETYKLIDGAGPDIRNWWEAHKVSDNERIVKELDSVYHSIDTLTKQSNSLKEALSELHKRSYQLLSQTKTKKNRG